MKPSFSIIILFYFINPSWSQENTVQHYTTKEVLYANSIIIPCHDNVTIKFSSNKFERGSEDCFYQYSLTDTSNWIKADIAFYTLSNMNLGDYILQIDPAVNQNTCLSNLLILTITIQPSFWTHPLVITLTFIAIVSVIITILILVIRYYPRIREHILNSKVKSSSLELALIRSQMKPHFIFNSLNSIYHYLLTGNIHSAQNFLTKVSHLIRNSLYLSKQPFISLSDEIEFINNYISIEKIRFDDRFDYTIKISGITQPDKILIPSLLLQPIVENSINHGISQRKDDLGKITIAFLLQYNNLICIIEDNGIGIEKSLDIKKSQSNSHQSMGNQLLQQRISLIKRIYKINIKLAIEKITPNTEYEGTKITITVPVFEQ